MRLNKQAERLKKLSKIDFGPYCALVEANVYEITSLMQRYEAECKKHSKAKRNARYNFMFYAVSTIVCPMILIALFINQVSVYEIMVYIIWMCVGFIFLSSNYKRTKKNIDIRNSKLSEINKTYEYVLEYVYENLNTFYDKKEDFISLTSMMSETELEALKYWVIMLEADLTVFTDILYFNSKLNTDDSTNIESNKEFRQLSREYLTGYLNDLSSAKLV